MSAWKWFSPPKGALFHPTPPLPLLSLSLHFYFLTSPKALNTNKRLHRGTYTLYPPPYFHVYRRKRANKSCRLLDLNISSNSLEHTGYVRYDEYAPAPATPTTCVCVSGCVLTPLILHEHELLCTFRACIKKRTYTHTRTPWSVCCAREGN